MCTINAFSFRMYIIILVRQCMCVCMRQLPVPLHDTKYTRTVCTNDLLLAMLCMHTCMCVCVQTKNKENIINIAYTLSPCAQHTNTMLKLKWRRKSIAKQAIRATRRHQCMEINSFVSVVHKIVLVVPISIRCIQFD